MNNKYTCPESKTVVIFREYNHTENVLYILCCARHHTIKYNIYMSYKIKAYIDIRTTYNCHFIYVSLLKPSHLYLVEPLGWQNFPIWWVFLIFFPIIDRIFISGSMWSIHEIIYMLFKICASTLSFRITSNNICQTSSGIILDYFISTIWQFLNLFCCSYFTSYFDNVH